MSDLKKWIIAWIVGFIILAIGIAMAISPLDKVITYKASGELLQTPAQWEDTKVVLAENKVNLNQIAVLDHGSTLLVQFSDLIVRKDFPYGTVTSTIGKTDGPPLCLEQVLIPLGGILFIVTTIGTCAERFNWS